MSERQPSIIKRLLKPDSLPILLLDFVIVFALGFFANELWSRAGDSSSSTGTAQEMEHDHEAQAGPQLWTCSMHPQIKKNKPGKCPLCGMDLIPLSGNKGQMSGMRHLVVSPEARALMNIQVIPVERQYVEAQVRMVGKVAYDETRLKHITAWVPGRLDRLFVDYTGVRVEQGDHMVYIYSEQLYASQQELIEALRAKRERGDQSNNEFFNTGGIDLLESAREKLRLLGLTKEQIAEIETLDKPSDHMMIYAPAGGIVIQKLKQEGDRVNTGERIYTVADLTQLWVRMDAYESDLMWLRYGQQVSFTTEAYPGEEFVGRIAFIDPTLDDRTRTVKVRVNIDNAEGKLKPDMFVRGEVKAKVAAGGRVIDAALEGKWISPMHPEIVKDEPGKCDICGMPLVRAESLGYVAAESAGLAKPLVIPVSAALVTGTRAIVYVEDPKAKEPTFEGREIVLGPRAGDYYLVRNGLNEGELVVTSGNFKIDSALQILAKPSMMTPEGGGGGGGHHHGGGSDKPAASGEAAPAMTMDLPMSLRMTLQKIAKAFQQVKAATSTGDREQIHAAWRQVGRLTQSVDAESLTGHPKMVWKELSMLLINDAVEGIAVIKPRDAQQLLASTTRTMQRLDQQLGLSHADHVPQQYDVPDTFRQQLAAVWNAYQQIGAALAADDAANARAGATALQTAVAAVDMKLLTDSNAHMAWMREQTNLQKITASLVAAEDIKAQRGQFGSLSGVAQVLAMSFGFGEQAPVYLHHCPMAFGNKGAIWLQADDASKNPYFGATMLKCADRVERIGAE